MNAHSKGIMHIKGRLKDNEVFSMIVLLASYVTFTDASVSRSRAHNTREFLMTFILYTGMNKRVWSHQAASTPPKNTLHD